MHKGKGLKNSENKERAQKTLKAWQSKYLNSETEVNCRNERNSVKKRGKENSVEQRVIKDNKGVRWKVKRFE